ncbi:hypothetical protein C815_01915 [Firmicutes bacterium M10-2]|nr:hypothetical protein C815_01915 [Firmicutes bacterium M10-2]
MIIESHKKDRYREAGMQDVRKNNVIHDHSGTAYRILEVVFGLGSWNMLIQHMDRRYTQPIPCDRINQYLVRE